MYQVGRNMISWVRKKGNGYINPPPPQKSSNNCTYDLRLQSFCIYVFHMTLTVNSDYLLKLR
jgi:hypothetical protein